MKFIDIDDLLEKTTSLQGLYDVFRVVDPVTKEIKFMGGKEETPAKDTPCYKIWETGQICDNCVSTRAINEDNVIIKMGNIDKKGLFMVTAVPILLEGQTYALELIQEVTDGIYLDMGTAHRELLKLTAQLAMQMDDLISKDELTRLFNRRYIEERLPADIIIARKNRQPLSLIFIDLDYFKDVNDIHGHLAGDEVLRQFAERIKVNIPHGGAWIARYGGEEFLICLPNIEEEQAYRIAEKIRLSVSGAPFIYDGKELMLTCSLGVYTVSPKDMHADASTVLQRLDKCLYSAKNSGRNCTKCNF